LPSVISINNFVNQRTFSELEIKRGFFLVRGLVFLNSSPKRR